MYEDFFSSRLSQLRNNLGVSARDMSLSIGQNPGYINNIETGKALPSMAAFFYIWEYLKITPAEFFSEHNHNPVENRKLENNITKLNTRQLNYISELIEDLVSKK